jgi:hypothetical protein
MAEKLIDTINSDMDLIKLAREIAMDINPIETILKSHSISDKTWSKLQKNTRFAQFLASEMEAWHTALNTQERVKIKSACMLEEWLPTLHQRINNTEEGLGGVVEAGKMLSRLAGLGGNGEVLANIGERFSITINMGPKVVEFEKEAPKIVDVTPNKDKFGEDNAPASVSEQRTGAGAIKKEHATHFTRGAVTVQEIDPAKRVPRTAADERSKT